MKGKTRALLMENKGARAVLFDLAGRHPSSQDRLLFIDLKFYFHISKALPSGELLEMCGIVTPVLLLGPHHEMLCTSQVPNKDLLPLDRVPHHTVNPTQRPRAAPALTKYHHCPWGWGGKGSCHPRGHRQKSLAYLWFGVVSNNPWQSSRSWD